MRRAGDLRTDAFDRAHRATGALHEVCDEILVDLRDDVRGTHAADIDSVAACAVVDIVVADRHGRLRRRRIEKDRGPAGADAAIFGPTLTRDVARCEEGLNDEPNRAGGVEARYVVSVYCHVDGVV